MRRREFIAGLGSAAAWPLAVRAQQTAMPVVRYLSEVARRLGQVLADSAGASLKAKLVGRNVTIDAVGWRPL